MSSVSSENAVALPIQPEPESASLLLENRLQNYVLLNILDTFKTRLSEGFRNYQENLNDSDNLKQYQV
jgi:hypothetical protein